MNQEEFVFIEDKGRSEEKADELLRIVQRGPRTTAELVATFGHRFSTSIQLLTDKGHLFRKEKCGSGCLYTHIGYSERVEVTKEMQAAYYLTSHWQTKRLDRLAFDDFRCCWCKQSQSLQVHHWFYELFAEPLEDLMTLCDACHLNMHENKAIKVHFPRFVTPDIAALLT